MSGLSQATGLTFLAGIDFTKYNFIIFGLLLIMFMLLRPQGLLPSGTRKAELKAGAVEGSMGALPETISGEGG
jgi:branched-chain amino acid transport system permease protein